MAHRTTAAQEATLKSLQAVRQGFDTGAKSVICHNRLGGVYRLFRIAPDGSYKEV